MFEFEVLGGDIAAPAGDLHLHVDFGRFAGGGKDRMIGVENVNVLILEDGAGGHRALPFMREGEDERFVAVEANLAFF